MTGGKIMKKTALIVFTIGLAVLLWAVPASAREVVRSFKQQIPVGSAGKIHLDIPVGSLHVEGWDGRQVDLDVQITCNHPSSRCEDAANKLRLVYNAAGGQLDVKIKDWPHWGGTKGLNVVATIHVPRDLPLQTNMGVGELTIQGIAADVIVDLGVGEVHVTLPKEAIGSAAIDTGIGEAKLSAGGRLYSSEGLFTRKINWDQGTGRARVKVDCGVGEIHVTLS
jgi:hypothetical protein